MKSFKEAKKELLASVKKGKNGKPIHSFSKGDFAELVASALNDTAYEMETVAIAGGEVKEVKTPVIKNLREKFIKPILEHYGVPKEEVENFVNEYQFKVNQCSTLYDFIADMVFQYMDAGKKFTLPNRKNFTGSFHMDEIPETVVERDVRAIADRSKIKGHKKEKRTAHKVLVKKSSCPAWQRFVIK